MTAVRTRAVLLRGPLGQAGALVGLLAVVVLLASAATVEFNATVQGPIPSPTTLNTTAPIEGAAS